MELDTAIERFLQQRTGVITDDSVALYRRELATWTRWRESHDCRSPLELITLDELDRFFYYLANEHIPHRHNPSRPAAPKTGLSPETVAAYRRVLRAFWRFSDARRWLSDDQRGFFGREGVRIARVPEVARPVYEESQFSEMLTACGDGQTEESARDRTLLSLLWQSGARITEILSIDDERLDLKRKRARIVGKGKIERMVRWAAIAQSELLRYLQLRRGTSGDPLFRASGPLAGEATRLTTNVARSRFKRIMEAADIDLVDGSPLHAFRRSFIQRGIDDGMDISDVSQLAGHRNIETTMRYARRNEEKLQEIYESGYVRRERRKK